MATPSPWTQLSPVPVVRAERSMMIILNSLDMAIRSHQLDEVMRGWEEMQTSIDADVDRAAAELLKTMVNHRWSAGVQWLQKQVNLSCCKYINPDSLFDQLVANDDPATLAHLLHFVLPSNPHTDNISLSQAQAVATAPNILRMFMQQGRISSHSQSSWALAALRTQSPPLVEVVRQLWGGNPEHPEYWMVDPLVRDNDRNSKGFYKARHVWVEILLHDQPELASRALSWGWGPPGDPGEWMWRVVEENRMKLWGWWYAQPGLQEAWLAYAKDHPEKIIRALVALPPHHRQWWDARLLGCVESLAAPAYEVMFKAKRAGRLVAEYAWWMQHAPLLLARDPRARAVMQDYPQWQAQLDACLLEATLERGTAPPKPPRRI